MIEIKVTVDIPGIAEAINNLAQAIAEKKPVAVEAVKQEAPVVQASAPIAAHGGPCGPRSTRSSACADCFRPRACCASSGLCDPHRDHGIRSRTAASACGGKAHYLG